MGRKGIICNTLNNKDFKKLKIKKIEGKYSRAFKAAQGPFQGQTARTDSQ